MGTWSSASQQVEIPTADSGYKIPNTLQDKLHLLGVLLHTWRSNSSASRVPRLWTLNHDTEKSKAEFIHMEHVPTGHCRLSVQYEHPPPANHALQDPEASFQSKRLNLTPLILVTTVLHTEVKLLKCFWKYRECYFLSKAVMYQERS